MQKLIEQLEAFAKDLKSKDEQLSGEVRKHGKNTRESFELLFSAIYQMDAYLFRVLERLEFVITDLKKQNGAKP